MRIAVLALSLLVVACNSDIDEPWQLAHDRIIAVRATPPRILPGEQAKLDVLLGYDAMPVEERSPDLAAVISPESMTDAMAIDAGDWVVTAPSEERLAAAREELKLPAGSPVPLQVGVAVTWPYPVMSPDGRTFGAAKTVWLGESGTNPELVGLTINGVPPGDELVVPKDTEVRLYVEADDTMDIVNWLTSCGVMHDFDLHSAYLTVAPEDPQEGELVLVLRDPRGGVTWRIWPIRAE